MPDNTELMKRLAYAYKKQGKIDEMIIEYERLMDEGVEDVASLRDLASAYGQQGRQDEQISTLTSKLSSLQIESMDVDKKLKKKLSTLSVATNQKQTIEDIFAVQICGIQPLS